MSRASERTRLWLPQHWPTWIALAIFRLAVAVLTPREQWRASGLLATLIFHVVRIRRRVVLANLDLCFPTWTEAQRLELARAHYRALVFGVFETATSWWADNAHLPPHRIVGLDYLKTALARGHGALLLTAHFTTLEIGGRMMIEAFGMGGLYRDPNNPVIAQVMRERRETLMTTAVHFDDLKGLVRALRAGHAIWYAPDQGKRTPGSEILPFFGVPAITNTATSKIARMTDTAVVPYFARRERDGSYTLTVYPALEGFPSEDSIADAIRINHVIEDAIRLAPEQYFWVHKRFKARGPEYPDVYR